MSVKTFFVNNGQSNVGPFDMSTIASMVNRLEIKATDYLCVNVEKDEWVMICQHPEFIEFVAQTAKPTFKPTMKAPVQEPTPAQVPSRPQDSGNPVTLTSVPMPSQAAQSGYVVPTADFTQAQWYVLKGKNRFGPFMYVDII